MKIKTQSWNKLVRDNIPEIIEFNGGKAKIKLINDPKKRLKFLEGKLLEETEEVVNCGKDGLSAECAGVLTVLESIVDEAGFDWEELKEMQAEKDKERGRFKKGVYLISPKG